MDKLRQRIPERAELADLLDIVDLLYETGIRRGEAQELKWSDVDLEKEQITIRPHKGAYERRVPIGANIVSVLRSRRRRMPNSEFVFGNSARALLRRAGTQFGDLTSSVLGRRLSLRSLRHAFALRWMDSGADIGALTAVLGIQSVETTLKVFDSSRQQLEQLQKLRAAFGG